MKFGKRLAVLVMASVSLTAMSANAQMAWGTGMAMAQQACPYNVRAGDGASSYLDEYNEIKKAKQDEEKKLREMERKVRNLEKNLDKNRQTIEDSIQSQYSSDILAHMENARLCSDYKTDSIPATGSNVTVDSGGKTLPPPANAQGGLTKLTGFKPEQWTAVCVDGQKGGINTGICVSAYASTDSGRPSPNTCKDAISNYRKDSIDLQKTQTDIERSKKRVEDYASRMPEVMRDAKQRYKEDQRAGTEGDVCLECLARGSGYSAQRYSPDWAGVAANVGVGLLATYMGYQTNKMVAQYNSDLGWPTQAYPAWGYALPFLANGLYGALGGGIGGGAFGCGGGVGGGGFGGGFMGGMGPFGMGGGLYGNLGMNGPFGYPYGMMGNPYGGGMFGGGMGPWGMGGYGGLGGMGGMGGIPMMGGFAMNGGIGIAMGGGYPMMGGGYPGMGGGIPMGGGYPGMGGGFAMNGGIGIPMMGGGYPGMGGGIPMMGGGYPGMGGGLAINGGIGLAMGGGGYPMMGMGYPMMGAAIGMGGGMGYPGMGGGMPMMGMDMMGGGGLGSMQMQQAMMQMQQQQMQLYMQQYQQQMQNQMARQQTMVGLQSELYNLINRIQQVQYGYGSSGYLGGSAGIGGSFGVGGTIGGGVTIPGAVQAPGSTGVINTGTTTTPGGVVIPTNSR